MAGNEEDSIESNTHSFIVRVWLEQTPDDNARTVWRGHITHVPSGKRRYFQDLEYVSRFIGAYLHEIGMSIGLCQRIFRSLRRVICRIFSWPR